MRIIAGLGRGGVFLAGWLGVIGAAATETGTEAEEIAGLTRGEIPVWIEPLAWENTTATLPPGTPGEILLNDAQTRLSAEGGDYFFRTVTRLVNRQGVQQNAELSVTFSPDYQSVTWHRLRIVRDGQEIDLLPKARFRRLQRELQLEGKIYDGRVTAMTVLEDIRVGDILESAYTLSDRNPLMRGHQSFRMSLGAGYPTRRQSVITRLPAELPRPTWYFLIPPDTAGLPEPIFRPGRLRGALRDTSSDEEHLYRWEETDIPPIEFDQAISAEAAPYYPQIRCSSFTDWARVVTWARGLFESVGPLPDEQRTLVGRWRQDPDARARLRAAVDWVQGELRYFSMAMGQHNVKPRPLAEITASRFGDCKDKTVLLVALLNELGIPAWPALVNAHSDHVVRHGGPDQYAFNHAIVAYYFDGRLRWVDPTLQQPAGRAGEWELPPYSAALILREDEYRLTDLPAPDLARIDTDTVDRIRFDEDGAAEIVSEVVLRGLQADLYRQGLEQISAAQRSKGWFNYLARFYRRIEELDPPVVRDDRAANEIHVRARYRVPDLQRDDGSGRAVHLHAYGLRTLLENPESRRRHWPLSLPYARTLRHRIEADLPFTAPLSDRPHFVQTAGLEYRGEKSLIDRRFTAVHELRFTARHVPPGAMPAFTDSLEEIFLELSTSLRAADPAAPATAVIPNSVP
jgi:transglutaminase-like putative cysteine protease